MKMKLKTIDYILILLVIILLVFSVYLFNTNKLLKSTLKSTILDKDKEIGNLNQNLESQERFFKDYIIAVNNIHIASDNLNLAKVNRDNANYETNNNQYDYTNTINLYDVSKDQATEAKDLLIKSKKKLDELEDKEPNEFYKKEVKNRLQEVDLLIKFAESNFKLSDLSSKELYEVNYGLKEKATQLNNEYNNVEIPKYNILLKQLSDIENEIDLNWEQDWYVTFQG